MGEQIISMACANFESECFDNFFNSEALSDRILNIVEVEEICCVSYTEDDLKINHKRKHKSSESGSACLHKNPRKSEDASTETSFTQYEEEVAEINKNTENRLKYLVEVYMDSACRKQVSGDIAEDVGGNVSPTEENLEVNRSEASTNGRDEPHEDIIGEQEDIDMVDNRCEAVDCKEEEAEQIDDPVVVSELGKSETDSKQVCSSSFQQIAPPSSKNAVTINNSPTERLTGSFLPMHMLFDNRENLRSQLPREDVIEKHVLKETTVYVHSVILAAKSGFFKCLFSTSGMKETKEQKVKVEVQKGETENMLILLHCFYNKNFVTTHSLQTVLKVCSLAMRYCYDGLIDKCLDVFRLRAETLSEVDDVNHIAFMVSKIQSELHQHKEKCLKVMKTFGPFLINTFFPLDECLETNPGRFFQLSLNSMYLLMDPMVQVRFNSEHGNLFIYAVLRWLKNRTPCFSNPIFKADVIIFIEKLLSSTNINDLTGDFLTNVMTYEHCPFTIWPGYKEWYIKALQDFVYKYYACNNSITDKQYPTILRSRVLKFVRQERNADIFSLTNPIILNGFEIGIYLRAREDRKVQIIAKCKNMVVNKTGFDKASLTFNLKGTIKVNMDSHLWLEHFPSTQSQWLQEWLTFSYKQNLMCLQMYGVCKLLPNTYKFAKTFGFVLALEIVQIR